MMGPCLLIRVDGSLEIGVGHVMRMLALAQACQQRGSRVVVVAAAMPEALALRLQSEQIETVRLERLADGKVSRGSAKDAAYTASLAIQIGAKWVVADGYRFDATYQSIIREAELQCAVVTDFDFCKQWCCDLILNQNPHATAEVYASAVDDCRRLLGTRFALLRHELLAADAIAAVRPTGDPKHLLITLGGSDSQNATGRLIELLDSYDYSNLEARVLLGAASPHQSAVAEVVRHSRHRIELLTDVRDMAQQYLWADGIVSAGGSTCWEWIYFGLQGAILVIADNQNPIYGELTANGMALGLGTIEDLLLDATKAKGGLMQLLNEMQRGKTQHLRYRHVVDGYGAQRVAAALGTGIWLRGVTGDDRELYFRWANEAEVRGNSLCSNAIDWTAHCQWLDEQLASPDVHLMVGMRDEKPIGQIRFNWTQNRAWNVGFSVARESRGTGVGKELLRLGTAWMAHRGLSPWVATVKQGNPASAGCFKRSGWAEIPSDRPELLQFRKTNTE